MWYVWVADVFQIGVGHFFEAPDVKTPFSVPPPVWAFFFNPTSFGASGFPVRFDDCAAMWKVEERFGTWRAIPVSISLSGSFLFSEVPCFFFLPPWSIRISAANTNHWMSEFWWIIDIHCTNQMAPGTLILLTTCYINNIYMKNWIFFVRFLKHQLKLLSLYQPMEGNMNSFQGHFLGAHNPHL